MEHAPTPTLTIAAAETAVAAAHRAFILAIRDDAGDVTVDAARTALDAARTELTAAQAAAAAQAQAAAAEAEAAATAQAEADQVAAAGAVAQVEAQVAMAVAAVAPPADAPALLSAPALPEVVARAAAEVSRAAAALERARVPLRAAMADRQLLADRLAVKEAASAAIRARRLAGDARDTDVAELHLFDSDAAELRGAIVDAETRVAALQPDEHLVRLHRDAEAALVRAQQEAVLIGMADRMRSLDAAIVAGAQALRAAGMGQQSSGYFNMLSIWRPSEELRRVAYGQTV